MKQNPALFGLGVCKVAKRGIDMNKWLIILGLIIYTSSITIVTPQYAYADNPWAFLSKLPGPVGNFTGNKYVKYGMNKFADFKKGGTTGALGDAIKVIPGLDKVPGMEKFLADCIKDKMKIAACTKVLGSKEGANKLASLLGDPSKARELQKFLNDAANGDFDLRTIPSEMRGGLDLSAKANEYNKGNLFAVGGEEIEIPKGKGFELTEATTAITFHTE